MFDILKAAKGDPKQEIADGHNKNSSVLICTNLDHDTYLSFRTAVKTTFLSDYVAIID